jgi:RNA polymerase sigma factor (sigma-70 family)
MQSGQSIEVARCLCKGSGVSTYAALCQQRIEAAERRNAMSYSTTGNGEVANPFQQVREGDARSLERLMGQHEGLVHVVARRQWRGCLGYEETVHEGRIGLWRAILGFDPARGVSFSTYAGVAIARQVWRAVDRQQRQDRDRAKEVDYDAAQHSAPCMDSLSHLVVQEVQDAVHSQVAALPAKQRWVVRSYYGLDGQGSDTLAGLGRKLGCSRQGVAYHLHGALVRLRHPAFSAALRALLGRNRREDYLQALQPERRAL